MVLLTFWITSSVSLTYSSSEAATAAGVNGKSHAGDERVAAAIDRNSRRRACETEVVEAAADTVEVVVLVALMGTSDLSLEVGVRSVGEAMALVGRGLKRRESVFVRISRGVER